MRVISPSAKQSPLGTTPRFLNRLTDERTVCCDACHLSRPHHVYVGESSQEEVAGMGERKDVAYQVSPAGRGDLM